MAYLVPADTDREAVRQYLREALTFAWDVHDSGSLEWQGSRDYIQWAGYEGGVLIETSSAQFMGYQHTPDQLARLQGLGFQDPDEQIPNHHIAVEAHEDLEGAADILLTVLYEVLLPDPSAERSTASDAVDLAPVPPEAVPPAAVSELDFPCVLLRISQLWHPAMDEDEVYDAVRGWWVMGPKRERASYALAVAQGSVRGVFAVHGWQSRTEPHGGLRWAFDGQPADEMSHLNGLDVNGLFPPGAANPVRYLNCDHAQRGERAAAVAVPSAGDVADLRATCASLMSNPMLALSLGAKELFHSNFLAWLVETNPACGALALPEVSPDDRGLRVRREAHHLDLVIEGATSLVIENKTFSLPDEDQLDRYAEVNVPALGLPDPTLLLLSLTDPGWPDRRYRGWRWLPYGQLAARISEAVQQHPFAADFDNELVRRWVDLVHDLERLVHLVEPHDPASKLFLQPAELEILRPTRLGDALGKARARRVRHALHQSFSAAGLRCDFLESNFTKGAPLLSAGVTHDDGCLLGWQLQGSQWRRFVLISEGPRGTGDLAKQRRIDHVRAQHPGWFDFRLEHSLTQVADAPSTTYKHFAPDFVYDYVKLADPTIGQVLLLGEQVLRAAQAAARGGLP